jgi:hypothetical protein
MNIYDLFGGKRKPALTESKIEVVHEYTNEDFNGLMMGVQENAEELHIGDPVVITGPGIEFEGTTGEIVDFGRDKRFVVVNLYNHGQHSFHSSDVSYNSFADSDEEEADAYDNDADARDWQHNEGITGAGGTDNNDSTSPIHGFGEEVLDEFAPGQGGGGNYFQALASAWYNGTFNSKSLQKGIKSQEDVERLLQRGIICPDGVKRKFGIDYNADFDGVVISSDDYYEYADHDNTDSRTGKPFGPYDYMEFSDDELDESVAEGIFGGLGGPASGPMLARGGPGYAGLSGAKKLRHDAYVELQMVDSLKHTNHNGRYDAEIKKKLRQAQEYLAKAKELEQGVAEGRVLHRDLKSWTDDAKSQGLNVIKPKNDLEWTHHATDKTGKVCGKFCTTNVPQNSRGFIHKQGVAEGSLKSQIADIDDMNSFYIIDDSGKILAGPFEGRDYAMSTFKKLLSQGADADIIQARALVMKLWNLKEQGVAEGSQPNDIAVYHHTGPDADKKSQALAKKLGSEYGHFRHDMADKYDNLHIVTQKRYFPDYAKQQGVAEAGDPNFLKFMNTSLGDRVDSPAAAQKTGNPQYDNAPVTDLDSGNVGYRAALDFCMKTLQKLTPTQKTKLATRGEDGVTEWLAKQAAKTGFLPNQFVEEDIVEVQDYLSDVFRDPAITSWALVLTDGEPLPKRPSKAPYTIQMNKGYGPGTDEHGNTHGGGYRGSDWVTVDVLDNAHEAAEMFKGLVAKNPIYYYEMIDGTGRYVASHKAVKPGLAEMDGDGAGRDGSNRKRIDSYGTRDREVRGPDVHLGPEHQVTGKQFTKTAQDLLNKTYADQTSAMAQKAIINKKTHESQDGEADYDDKYQAMVQRVGQKAREQEKHKPVDIAKLAQRLRQADAERGIKMTDEEVYESRLSAMKRAGYDIL